ncbi:MAG: sigma-70 family RNA polymerase sigma factor [Phycisphaerales bacterium]|nr:MAG: sigma-70 family RNA polymerase sigma factor [Phycisphaerales bacterium]
MSIGNFTELIERHGAQVLNTAVRILGDTQKAQDVHQEVFLEIWRRWSKYNGRTKWKPYLYRVTVRKAMESAKRDSRYLSLAQQNNQPLSKDTPCATLQNAEFHQKLVESLAKLPKRQAEVFVLAGIEGLEHETIAESLGCSRTTVRVHLYRAVRRLAREMADYLAR